MRGLVIIAVLVALVGGGGWWLFGMFGRMASKGPDIPSPALEAPAPGAPAPKPPAPPTGAPPVPAKGPVVVHNWVHGDPEKFFQAAELEPEHPDAYDFGLEPSAPRPQRRSEVIAFMNRPVPSPRTAFTEGAGGSDTAVTIDEVANAWIVTGLPDRIEDYRKLAAQLDIPTICVDLDLVLVAISEERLKALGITSSFLEGATWLNSFDLGFSTAGLQLTLGDGYIRVDLENSDESISVLSMPTIRIVTGEPFSFGNVDQVPIASRSVTEQSETTSFTYRDVGLQFSGLLTNVGNRYFLKLEQSQGTVASDDNDEAPRFRTAQSTTTLTVDLDAWSPATGLMIERTQWKRGFLSKRDDHRSDLVLVFVRPRTYLEKPLEGLPVDAPLQGKGLGVLPPLGDVPGSK